MARHPLEEHARGFDDPSLIVFQKVSSFQDLHGIEGQLQIILHPQNGLGQADLAASLPVEDVGFGDLAVPLIHQDRFHHVLDGFHVQGLVAEFLRQVLDHQFHQALGDLSGLGRVLQDFKGRPVNGVLDLLGGKGNDRPVPFHYPIGDTADFHSVPLAGGIPPLSFFRIVFILYREHAKGAPRTPLQSLSV